MTTDGEVAGAPDRTLPHALALLPAWIGAYHRFGRLSLFLDVDGTLAPIAPRPELARILPSARQALDLLSRRPGVDVAVVSGRAVADAISVVGLPGLVYAGNHGLQVAFGDRMFVHPGATRCERRVASAADGIQVALAGIPGVLVERKGATAAVHYRLAPRSRLEEIRTAVDRLAPGLRITGGKEVLEVRPPISWDKGSVVRLLLRCFGAPPGAPALYIGDDVGDEAAFLAIRRGRRGGGDGVVVAETDPPGTAARSILRDPGEVAELLLALADGIGAGDRKDEGRAR